MDNHYHLFIQTPEANLVEGMKWFQNTVTRRFNVRHREWGRLFGDRYKAVVVDGESPYYYETLWDYIHLNPGRAGLVDVTCGQSVLDYPWGSLAGTRGQGSFSFKIRLPVFVLSVGFPPCREVFDWNLKVLFIM